MIAFRINASGVTDTGIVRSVNEDSMALRSEEGLWVVADGMGGHTNGKWASEQIAVMLSQVQLGADFDADVAAIGAAVQDANIKIVLAAEKAGTVIGSTVAILYLADARFAVLWAGDSRVYLCRDGKLVQLTLDHTYVQELVASGALRPEEAKSHPNQHVLSRAIGVDAKLELDAVADEALPLDVFLLCSDGLTGLVSDAEIMERLHQFPPHVAAKRLLELSLSRGAPDNVTIIVVRCEEKTKLEFAGSEYTDV